MVCGIGFGGGDGGLKINTVAKLAGGRKATLKIVSMEKLIDQSSDLHLNILLQL